MATEKCCGGAPSPGTCADPSQTAQGATLRRLLGYLGSLRITVVLFALAIFLVFAGTMAQTMMDIWEVVNTYFRCFFAHIKLQVFFPPSFFPSKPQVPGAFWFPGGWLIGGGLVVNLAAASLLRFPVKVRGRRLLAGLFVTLLGAVTVWLVVASGTNKQGIHSSHRIDDWTPVWWLFLAGLGVAWFAGVVSAVRPLVRGGPRAKTVTWLLVAALAILALLGVGLAWLVVGGESVQLNDSNMRILWQLMKATFAALVLQAGCSLLFQNKGALVVVHIGIVLMMLGELLVGLLAVEAYMSIREGETVNFVENNHRAELAFVDSSDPARDEVVVVPASLLEPGRRIADADLPLDFEVLEYFPNSVLRDVAPGLNDRNPATAGLGLREGVVAVAARESIGTESRVDAPSAYIRFFEKGGDKPVGDYLLSRYLSVPEPIAAGGRTYQVSLRAKRIYKPYSMRLIDVRKDDYVGTNTPRNYSSDVYLTDPSRSVERQVKIWMNNPLRFAGETFYQSNFTRDPRSGVETTGFSVVTNTGWMIPYVGCMVVSVGLLVHFWLVLLRFVRRVAGSKAARAAEAEEDEEGEGEPTADSPPGERPSRWFAALGWVVPAVVVLLAATMFLRMARPPEVAEGEMDLAALGRLPVAYQGRVKPLDTLARNTLRIVSNRETFVDEDGNRQPALRWLVDMIVRPKVGHTHKVFRIEFDQLLNLLGLEARAGHRYAMDEFVDKLPALGKQVLRAQEKAPEELDHFEKKVLDFQRNLALVDMIVSVCSLPQVRSDHLQEDVFAVVQRERQFAERHPPLIVPIPDEVADEDAPAGQAKRWQTVGMAYVTELVGERMGRPPNPAVESILRILVAYALGESETFNREVAAYQAYLDENPPDEYDAKIVRFEASFNHAQLFFGAWLLYIVAFVASCLGFLLWFWQRPIGRSIFWLLVLLFVVHSLALGGRVMISGRPPVTNLYSSALFIGWSGVLFGLVIQATFRLGIGNLVAALSGMATLHIAYQLAADGDTFRVMQAVLDTNFWLTTHVLTIALGYASTFVAGALGILYILVGVFTPSLDRRFGDLLIGRRSPLAERPLGEVMHKMIYGVLCFALFFSFIGTVLGGLWADDSWGRFWGWDPKENGALIIVLWNALVLHALFGRMVRSRGLAVLAVAGNICTAWSWFGVNELGVGLHSYGFTEGVLLKLGLFVGTQLLAIALGLMPRSWWWSHRAAAG